jgi:hypothetical protein
MAVSCRRLPTEEAGRHLMEAEQQRILELNVGTLAKEACFEEERIAMNAEFTMRWRFAMIQQAASVRGENDGEAGSWDIAHAYRRRVGGLFVF